MSRNAKSFTGKAEVLLGGCLYADGIKGKLQHGCNILSHLLNVRREVRCLCHDGGIDIADLPSFFAYERGCSGEQNTAINVFVCRIGIGKMLSDIPQSQSPKQCVTNGVQQYVGIGVTEQPFFVRNRHTAQNQSSLGDKPMHVIAVTYAKAAH